MSDLTKLVGDLDEMTGKGEILDALDAFYCESCTFTEVSDGASRANREAQHHYLSGFFSTLKGFNGATLHSSAVGDDVTHSEWTFDMTTGNGLSIIWNEVLVRRWSDGKVVEEKFYNASA